MISQYRLHLFLQNQRSTTAAFQRAEFEGLTQPEIDKLAIFAEGLKAGRTTEDLERG